MQIYSRIIINATNINHIYFHIHSSSLYTAPVLSYPTKRLERKKS